MQFDIHTPVRSSTGVLARLEASPDVPFRLLLLSSHHSASHSAQPVFALAVGVHVAAVALDREPSSRFCGTRGLPCRSTWVCGPPQLMGRRRLLARVVKRPLARTLSPVAVRHLEVIAGSEDVRGQYIHLSFHVVHERRCNYKHGFCHPPRLPPTGSRLLVE